MLDKLKDLAAKAKDAISTAAVTVGDLNGDGVVDEKDAKLAADWAKEKVSVAGEEAARLGKEALRSDMVKQAAAYAAVGAAVAVPVPVVGPIAGAAVGAAAGAIKSFTSKDNTQQLQPTPSTDIHAELLKLNDLKEKGILTESEFDIRKKKLLDGNE